MSHAVASQIGAAMIQSFRTRGTLVKGLFAIAAVCFVVAPAAHATLLSPASPDVKDTAVAINSDGQGVAASFVRRGIAGPGGVQNYALELSGYDSGQWGAGATFGYPTFTDDEAVLWGSGVASGASLRAAVDNTGQAAVTVKPRGNRDPVLFTSTASSWVNAGQLPSAGSGQQPWDDNSELVSDRIGKFRLAYVVGGTTVYVNRASGDHSNAFYSIVGSGLEAAVLLATGFDDNGKLRVLVANNQKVYEVRDEGTGSALTLISQTSINCPSIKRLASASYQRSAVAAWQCGSGANAVAYASALGGSGFASPTQIDSRAAAGGKVAASATSDKSSIAWSQPSGTGSAVLAQQYDGSWHAAEQLSSTATPVASLAAAALDEGTSVAWTEPTGAGELWIARSGTRAVAPTRLSDHAASSAQPKIASNGTQALAVAQQVVGSGSAVEGYAPPVRSSAPNPAAYPGPNSVEPGDEVWINDAPSAWNGIDGSELTGLGVSGLRYGWWRCNNNQYECSDLQAPASDPESDQRGYYRYLPNQNDVDSTIRAQIFADSALGRGRALSTPIPVFGPPVFSSDPQVLGTRPAVGASVSPDYGIWNTFGNQIDAIEGEWLRCDLSGDSCSVIAGADPWNPYELVAADAGHSIRYRTRLLENGRNRTTSSTSEPFPTSVAPAPGYPGGIVNRPTLSKAPSIGGGGVGKDLVANPGEWSQNPLSSISYQWLHCTGDSVDSCTPVERAQQSSDGDQLAEDAPLGSVGRTLPAAELTPGDLYRVRVTATNAAGNTVAVSESIRAQKEQVAPPVEQPTGEQPSNTTPPDTSTTPSSDPPVEQRQALAPAPKVDVAPSLIEKNPSSSRKLRGSLGTWSGNPKLDFHWLRCDRNGANCAQIAATPSLNQQVDCPVDRNRSYRLEVIASTSGGSVRAVTTNTAEVDCSRSLCWSNSKAESKIGDLGRYDVTLASKATDANRALELSLVTAGALADGKRRTSADRSLLRARSIHRVKYLFKSDQRTVKFVTHSRPDFSRAIGAKQLAYAGTYEVTAQVELNPSRLRRYFNVKRKKPLVLQLAQKFTFGSCGA